MEWKAQMFTRVLTSLVPTLLIVVRIEDITIFGVATLVGAVTYGRDTWHLRISDTASLGLSSEDVDRYFSVESCAT